MGIASGAALEWYAIRVRPAQRQVVGAKYRANPADAPFLVEHFLQLKGFETFVPRRKAFRFANGVAKVKREKDKRAFPAMPGWMFVGWPEGENRWRELFDTPGVSGVAGQDGKPARISARAIRILARDLGIQLTAPEREKHMPTYKEYAPGQTVKIVGGAWENLSAVVIDVTGPTARVLAKLFGSEHEVKVPAMLLEAA